MRIPQRGKLTPTRTDVGKRILYVPEGEEGVLVDVNGIFAHFKFRANGRFRYAICDVRNLKLIREAAKK